MKSPMSVIYAAFLMALFNWPLLLLAQTHPNTPSASNQSPAPASPVQASPRDGFHPRTNLVFIMRHATAPGTGDPAGYRIGDCSTQRNLSKDGIRQSQEIGKRLKDLGLAPTAIWSSQWCRAIDTATHLGLGTVTTLPELNSFFTRTEQGPLQIQGLDSFLADLDPAKGPYVMVTHQVVITALTGVFPGSGEGVWIRLTGDKNRPWVAQP